jgi:hypothetical protein
MSSMYPSSGGVTARPCMRCGAPLASNESQCSRCGLYNPLPQQGRQFGMLHQGNGSGSAEPSWGSQVAQTPPLFPPAGNGGSAASLGPTGQGGGWSQNKLFAGPNQQFAGPNQQPSPSRQLPQGLFPPSPSTGQLGQGQGQMTLNNPNQSALSNSFAPFPQNPNQSALNNSYAPSPQNPNQPALNNPFSSFPQNPNQSMLSNPNRSALNNSFASFPQNPNQPMLSNPNQSALNNPFTPFQQNPNQSSLGNSIFNNATQQNSYGASPSGTGMLNGPQRNWQAYQANKQSQNSEDEDEEPKKRPSAFALVGIIVLVLLVIGGGAYGAFYFLRHNSSSNNTTNTSSSVVTPNVTPLFSDTFQNNSNGWDLTSPTGASSSIANGQLVLEDHNNKLFQELVPGGKTFNDLRVDVDADLTKGDQPNGYGIYIRGALNADGILGTYYCFEIYGDGIFAFFKGAQNADGSASRLPLKPETASNAILFAGQTNHLTAIAQGTQMTFQINGTTVYTFSDDSYKGGSVALFVSNVPGAKPGAQAVFERLAIFPPS